MLPMFALATPSGLDTADSRAAPARLTDAKRLAQRIVASNPQSTKTVERRDHLLLRQINGHSDYYETFLIKAQDGSVVHSAFQTTSSLDDGRVRKVPAQTTEAFQPPMLTLCEKFLHRRC